MLDPLTGGTLDTGAEEVGTLDVPVSSMLTAIGVPDPVVEVDAPESTKMSFWAPITRHSSSSSFSHIKEGGSTRTVLETTFHIVPWALGVSTQIIPFDECVVPFQLIPDHSLLRALHTLALIIFAPDGRVRSSDRLGRGRVRNDFAPVGEHEHVWFTTAICNLQQKRSISGRKRLVSRSSAYPVELLVTGAKS